MSATQTSALTPEEVTPAATEGEAVAVGAPPRVIGIDLSLRHTGVAGAGWTATVVAAPVPLREANIEQRWRRLARIRAKLVPFIDSAQLVVLEGPAYNQGSDPGAHERAALWWLVVGRCTHREIPLAVVSPSTLKVYATGSGKASKTAVVDAAARRMPHVDTLGDDNAADALWLAAMGLDHLGHPVVDLPKTHRRALASVPWPGVAL